MLRPATFLSLCAALTIATTAAAQPLTNAFTYQGDLSDAGSPAAGPHDLRFRLYTAAAGGIQIGATLCADDTAVADGHFTALLDFGAAFAGQRRFLEVDVRQDTGLDCTNPAGFTTLLPRQELTAAPNAAFALSAASANTANFAASATTAATATTATTATNATQLDGQLPAFYRNAANLNAGAIPDARFAGTYTNPLSLTNAGNAFAGAFTGSGAGLTNLNGSNIATGTVPDVRLSTNVALLANTQTITGAKTFSNASNLFTGAFTGSGAGLTGLNASSLSSGVLADARLSGNVALLNAVQTLTGAKTFSGGLVTNSFRLTSGPVAGRVLQSDAAGEGSWELDGISLPHSSSVTTAADAINFTQAGTGDGLQVTLSNTANVGEAIEGRTAGGGDAIQGINTGTGRAGFFQIANTSNSADVIYAETDGPGEVIVAINTYPASTTYGIRAEIASTFGSAIHARATKLSGSSHGVHGETAASDGDGVRGFVTATIGQSAGVRGETASASGRGVVGSATNTTGFNYGVIGSTSSVSGKGVYGPAFATSGANYGVHGLTNSNTDGYGVFSTGRTGATGTKSFRIDHPDDPENKYLHHYAAESPEVINFYSGTVLLNQAGEAQVDLPHYFAKINAEPRYTLTAVGAPMPMLHVAEKIDVQSLATGAALEPNETAPLCSFRIAGGAPGGEVSWEVKALRNDRWVQRHGAPVEADKPGSEKGTYQHPDLYNQPRERATNFTADDHPTRN